MAGLAVERGRARGHHLRLTGIRGVIERADTAPAWQLALVVGSVLLSALAVRAFQDDLEPLLGMPDAVSGAPTALSCAAFTIAALLARERQPENGTWRFLLIAAIAFPVEDFGLAVPWLNLPDWTTSWIPTCTGAALAALVLAFPAGRLATTRDRAIPLIAIVASPFAAAILSWEVAEDVGTITLLLLTAMVIGIVAKRWRDSSRPARRMMDPFLTVAMTSGVLTLLLVPLQASGWQSEALTVVFYATMCFLPFSFWLGIVRLEFDRVAITQRVAALPPGAGVLELRDTVAAGLDDDRLRVLPRGEADELLDEAGCAVDPKDLHGTTSRLVRDGRSVGVLVSDPALVQDERLLRTVEQAVAAWLDRRRLLAEVAEHEARERRRIQRDLHDGAQQRIAAIGMWLGTLRTQLDAEHPGHSTVDRLDGEVTAALAELRALTSDGLAPVADLDAAVHDLAQRTPTPVRVEGRGPDDLSPELGATAYFVVSEGVTNALKHSGSGEIEVRLDAEDGCLTVAVVDRGRGGAEIAPGGGLEGLRRRVELAGGALDLASANGTELRAQLPLV